jgi:hypothetical protein
MIRIELLSALAELESAADGRTQEQKILELYHHPATEPALKSRAKDWLDKHNVSTEKNSPDLNSHEDVLNHHGFKPMGHNRGGASVWDHPTKGHVKINITPSGKIWSHSYQGNTRSGFGADTLHNSLKNTNPT